jgi:hypothetical protein
MSVERISYEGSASEAKDIAAADASPEQALVSEAFASGEYRSQEQRDEDRLAALEEPGERGSSTYDWQPGEDDYTALEVDEPQSLLAEHRALVEGATPEQVAAYVESLPEHVQQQLVRDWEFETAQQQMGAFLEQSQRFQDERAQYAAERQAMFEQQETDALGSGTAQFAAMVEQAKSRVGSRVDTQSVMDSVESVMGEAAELWRREGADAGQVEELIRLHAAEVIDAAVKYQTSMGVAHRVLGKPPGDRASWAQLSDGRWLT